MAAVAAGGALAGLAYFGPTLRGVVGAVFLAVLVVLAGIDVEQHRLPNRIVLPAAGAALVVQTLGSPDRAFEWILASAGASLALLFLAAVNPSGLGMGDVKLALLLGAVLGKAVVGALVIAFLSVFPVALYVLVRHGSSARKTAIPFGPFLAFGAALALFLSS